MPCSIVCSGATLKCVFGLSTSSLEVTPVNRSFINNIPIATIMDCVPDENIFTFGECISPENPEFISATAAADGVPTPVACLPAITEQWIPDKPEITVGAFNILTSVSKIECIWSGVISVVEPGQLYVSCDD
jgi:hypothetical protein